GQTIVKLSSNSSQTVVGAKGSCGEFAAFRLRRIRDICRWRICSLRIAVNLPETPTGGELDNNSMMTLAPYRHSRMDLSGNPAAFV
ncbi:MAG: hypothetical protein PHU76_05695, partial [Synergistaceae bacterium]|nr:hypothetical protein [Synergistaceae bacterium]